MAKKGAKKTMVVSKTKRASHMKHKKTYKAGARVRQPVVKTKLRPGDRTQPNNSRLNPQSNKNATTSIPGISKKKKMNNTKPIAKNPVVIQDDFEADEMMDMMDEEDVTFLKNNATKKEQNGNLPKKRKLEEKKSNNVEEEYNEELFNKELTKKETKHLLPIKTKQGIVEQSIEVDYQTSDEEEDHEDEDAEKEEAPKSMAEMYAQRKQKLEDLKALIGSSSSNILENPDERMEHISAVLKLYNTLTPDIFITGFKLVSASLVELFKDLAPGFEIKSTSKPGERLKKLTREVYGNEARLLKYYQMFLKKLEDTLAPLKEMKKNPKNLEERAKRVAIFALKCLSDLLVAMPHFNFSKNIVHALIPFTAHKMDEVRLLVCSAFKKLFKDDKKGEISLHAVRQVNHLIKNKRHHQIPPDCLDILIALRIKDVNLDKEREEEINRYKTLTRKEKLLILSKNERRRRKKIERLEKEIVVARAEHSKGSKSKYQTETVKLVFTIYFRILKMAPKSGLMGVVLQGLAKFAHTINVDFFTDLVEVFNNLIANDQLDYRQCLYAIQVVLIMLSGQGEALNIDPLHFYSHLYKVLFSLTAGPSNSDMPIALDCLENMLIKRRKKVSIHRVLAFTKRVATLALQVQHNSSIGLLSLVRILMMTHKQTDMLLDLDTSSGSGTFLAELEEPEHCNAGSTALWELHSLVRHYHPIVNKFARHILLKNPTTGNGALSMELTRKTPLELHKQYDPSLLAFQPAVPGPSSTPINLKKLCAEEFHNSELEALISKVLQTDHMKLWEKDIASEQLALVKNGVQN
ncbi:nucleolar complex protein 3 homolog [Daphnia carinata]|uniref:nucleolar complex protein 3 homolog n=1 Tax=Daphnia carinata TaxID=120202 RepID=UPI00257F58E9|nr:nucleolar complex protein 3 homolog [Daphnia carinata]